MPRDLDDVADQQQIGDDQPDEEKTGRRGEQLAPPARRSDHEEERLTEIQAHRRPGGLPLRQALCDEQRRHDRDQLVRKVDNGFADEGRQDSRQMRAVERGIDRVAGADAAPAAADDEIDRGRENRRNRGAHQPEGDPAAGPFRPVEIPAQTGGKPDGKRDDAIGRGDRINRVGADQVADEANAAAHPWAGDDPGQNGARRIEKYRQVEGDGNRVTGEVEAERRHDQDQPNRAEVEFERTSPAGGLE